MEHRACQERCILLKQQQQIIRSLLQTQRDPTVRSSRGSLRSSLMSQMDETVRYIGNDRGSDIIDRKKREFREREESLRERKKNIEALIAWKKRIEQEEKIVREKEKLIAQSSFSAQLPESVVERGTSPVPEMKETSEEPIKPSTTEIQAMPATGSPFFTKAMRMPMIKTPLSPRVTIVKRRHSSGSDESMLLSQNDTLSEPSDVDVRVSALEQQLRHRKSELAKLKREYQKNQKERLRSTERNLINQIQVNFH
ncbi:unnamed protein product [Nesidiocoris tenuis]|uniref:Uncharacterized protein n=1 Tax=Nesidiocoris tenuis TaxID=355587 RepID=A0A6H5FYI3_9HEMI|nr:unnamed protein product [Nesidiocoris tenuis]